MANCTTSFATNRPLTFSKGLYIYICIYIYIYIYMCVCVCVCVCATQLYMNCLDELLTILFSDLRY